MRFPSARGTIFFTTMALALAACDSKAGIVEPSAFNPTPSPSPTATPIGIATPTPTPVPGGPTPTPTPVAPACAAPPPDPVSTTLELIGPAATVTLPCFADTQITASIPANNGTAAAPISVAVQISQTNNLGSKPSTTKGTVIGYTSLSPNNTVSFTPATAAIQTTFTSPSLVTAGHTYSFEAQVKNFNDAVIQSGTATQSGDTLSFGIAPPGGAFNGGLDAIIVLYRK